MLKFVSAALLICLHTACVPSFLDKYRQQEVRPVPGSAAAAPQPRGASPKGTRRLTPVIVQVNEGTFRVPMHYNRAWDTLLDVLLQNYNLQIVDKNSGILTSEWDSFYLDGKVHRNKVSLRMKRIGNQGVDLTIHNNVEVLSRVPDGVSEVWLPSDRTKPEIGRIIQNLAIQSGTPKPNLTAEYQPSGQAPKTTPSDVR